MGYAAPKRPPKTCQKETEKEEGDAKAPPTHFVGGRGSAFRPTHRHPPPISWAETPTPAARFPTRLLHQPNLVIRETIPTLNIQSDERDCPGLRVGPAHVVAHRLSLP